MNQGKNNEEQKKDNENNSYVLIDDILFVKLVKS